MSRHDIPRSLLVVRIALAAACTAGLALAPAPAGADARAESGPSFSWELIDSGSVAFFTGVDAVSADVAWMGSLSGKVVRTVDGGETLEDVTPAQGAGLFYQDVEAANADTALVVGFRFDEPSRIYRTTDGGATWTETFRAGPDNALTCMAMFDRRHGFVIGDPVDGKFRAFVTSDAGRSWDQVSEAGMPPALDGEEAVVDSGGCAAATGRRGFFGTAVGAGSRVFRSSDLGLTWQVSPAPVGTEILGLDFRTNRLGVAVGGDGSGSSPRPVARTTDGGVTWQPVDPADAPAARRSDVAWWSDRRGDQRGDVPDAQRTVFAVGFSGSDVSLDRGKTWQQFDANTFASVDCAEGSLGCWAVGQGGRIAKLAIS